MRFKIIFILIMMLAFQIAQAEDNSYYLCGPDEDGCPEGQEQYCACIPFGPEHNKPYCLNLDTQECNLIGKSSKCPYKMDFHTQGECLATLMQSEPNPPCKEETKTFCETHPVYMCDETGNPDRCKKQMINIGSVFKGSLVHRKM